MIQQPSLNWTKAKRMCAIANCCRFKHSNGKFSRNVSPLLLQLSFCEVTFIHFNKMCRYFMRVQITNTRPCVSRNSLSTFVPSVLCSKSCYLFFFYSTACVFTYDRRQNYGSVCIRILWNGLNWRNGDKTTNRLYSICWLNLK